MLSAQDLSVDVQGSRVLRGISFEIKAGELVYLVGRNGADKTTTFRTIMGFRKPAAAQSRSTASTSRGCGPTRSRASASASPRRRARCSAS